MFVAKYRRAAVWLSASRLPSVDLLSREDFRLLAIGTATRVTVVSEKLRFGRRCESVGLCVRLYIAGCP